MNFTFALYRAIVTSATELKKIDVNKTNRSFEHKYYSVMKLKKIKLNALSRTIVENKAMSALRGGNCCECSCYWEGQGGSSSSDNMNANYNKNTYSIQGCNLYQRCDDNDGSWREEAHA